ncbi:MAG: hypothetical protein NTU41_10145 [Chloroflexi bacterium]|nr:hypothetical protein [Chloroflexota bacterium]
MSKLVKRLRQTCEDTARPMGFRTSPGECRRQMVLVARVPDSDVGLVAQVAKAHIDAILIRDKTFSRADVLRRIGESAGDVPWGLWADFIDADDPGRLTEAGGDFIVLDRSTAPATVLQEGELGKVLLVGPSEEDSLVGAVDELPVDLVLLDGVAENGVLTIRDIMCSQRLSLLVEKPLLVATRPDLTDVEVQSLWEAGVRGLVVEGKGPTLDDTLAKLSQSIERLRPPKKRSDRRAVLPYLGYRSEEPSEDPDD